MTDEPVTMYLRKEAPGPVAAARGPHAARLEPGTYVDVPPALVELLTSLGAIKRSRPDGEDAPNLDEAGDAGEET